MASKILQECHGNGLDAEEFRENIYKTISKPPKSHRVAFGIVFYGNLQGKEREILNTANLILEDLFDGLNFTKKQFTFVAGGYKPQYDCYLHDYTEEDKEYAEFHNHLKEWQEEVDNSPFMQRLEEMQDELD